MNNPFSLYRAPAFYVTVRGRRRYFATLDDAKAHCEAVFRQTGIVLGIESE